MQKLGTELAAERRHFHLKNIFMYLSEVLCRQLWNVAECNRAGKGGLDRAEWFD